MSAAELPPGRRINLTFHGVGEPIRQLDAGEQDVWLGSDRFLSILDAVVGRPDVTISFDDGNVSDVRDALPALGERCLTATFFVVAGRLGTPGFVGERDVQRLAGAGMTIGCHGMHHRPWRHLNDRELRDELLEARRRLEDVVGHAVTEAACPFGAYDRRVLRSLHRYGYRRVFTSDRGPARSDRWLQARNTLRASDRAEHVSELLTVKQPLASTMRREARLTVKRWR